MTSPVFVTAAVLSMAPHRFLCPQSICSLPADCEGCARFTCEECRQPVAWDEGCADDHFGKCDSCVAKLRATDVDDFNDDYRCLHCGYDVFGDSHYCSDDCEECEVTSVRGRCNNLCGLAE